MSVPTVLSVFALGISLISLVVSVYFNLRDRGKVVAFSTYSPGAQSTTSYLGIVVVNAGRRPIVLRMWVAEDKTGQWTGEQLGEQGAGLRIEEHGRTEIILWGKDLPLGSPNCGIVPTNIWVEDTLGRAYSVKNVKANLQKLVGSLQQSARGDAGTPRGQ